MPATPPAPPPELESMVTPAQHRHVRHLALIGNFLPRRCGIATFTFDTYWALRERYPEVVIDMWAMNDDGRRYDYPAEVTGSIESEDPASYRLAAREIESAAPAIVWLQHEFGIFGGAAGQHVLTLIDRLSMPIAVTLHTVLSQPNNDQRRVMDALVARCSPLIVMAEEGRRLLVEVYGAADADIIVIPHGIPDRPLNPTAAMKERLALAGRRVAMTFGLLSPGKGIETMIAAMPAIVAAVPEFTYVIAGETHPHVVAHEGEAYRERLQAQAEALGVADHIRWVNDFMDTDALLDYLEAVDVYVTPYLNAAQITSGTLAYAVGLGKPVVATPYVHAKELLADGLGTLVDFGDSDGFAAAIVALFADPARLERVRQRTYAVGRTMIWPRLVETAMDAFERAIDHALPVIENRDISVPARLPLTALERMTDDVGIAQHSVFGIPDRAHGYCTDDNARALLLACEATWLSAPDRAALATPYAAFLQHAWNYDLKTFRNFMGYNRQWLEDAGSHDSSGRALWALATAAAKAPNAAIRQWAATLFDTAVDSVMAHKSLRTRAFCMLGASALWSTRPGDGHLVRILTDGANAMMHELEVAREDEWRWFEPVLAYDNARLPEALLRAGAVMRRRDWVDAGIATLRWIGDRQLSPSGRFRAVGSDSFGRHHAPPLPYDQQPLEAAAMVDACAAAFAATHERHWQQLGLVAYRWFLGDNDQRIALADPTTGECFDGLIPTGVNRNQGAESVLAFYLATIAAHRLQIASAGRAAGVSNPLGERGTMRHQALHAVDTSVAA